MLDANDITYFSENHDVEGLHWALSEVFQRSKRNSSSAQIKNACLGQVYHLANKSQL
jgi:hypothetical protein